MDRRWEDTEDSKSKARTLVFTNPGELEFDGRNREDRQILRIYNPYDFPIRFQLLSTKRDHYEVYDREGSISSKKRVDLTIVLTRNVPIISPVPLESRFQLNLKDYSTRKIIGQKIIPSRIIYDGRSRIDDFSLDEDDDDRRLDDYLSIQSESVSTRHKHSTSSVLQRQQLQRHYIQQEHGVGSSINYVAIVTGILCIISLLLPYEDNHSSSTMLPSYLHLSVNIKLLSAYGLGLVTMVLFRS